MKVIYIHHAWTDAGVRVCYQLSDCGTKKRLDSKHQLILSRKLIQKYGNSPPPLLPPPQKKGKKERKKENRKKKEKKEKKGKKRRKKRKKERKNKEEKKEKLEVTTTSVRVKSSD